MKGKVVMRFMGNDPEPLPLEDEKELLWIRPPAQLYDEVASRLWDEAMAAVRRSIMETSWEFRLRDK